MKEYPTEEELEEIRTWNPRDYANLMEYVDTLWKWGIRIKDGKYHLATGGWSGNEDIIDALRDNFIIWSRYWESSHSGGLHIFASPESNMCHGGQHTLDDGGCNYCTHEPHCDGKEWLPTCWEPDVHGLPFTEKELIGEKRMENEEVFSMLAQLLEQQETGFESEVEVIEPGKLGSEPLKQQKFVKTNTVLDRFFDGKGVPQGCTGILSGPPGCGKTRTIIQLLVKLTEPVLLVLSEENFYDHNSTGRDDMRSRIAKEADDVDMLESRYCVLQTGFTFGNNWTDFVRAYKSVCEERCIKLVLIDSMNCLDDNSRLIERNLIGLKAYNHQHGITCIMTGHVRDTGSVAGGNSIQHIADVIWHVEDLTMTSKDMAAQWGAGYRETIQILRGIKCNVVPMAKDPFRIVMVDGFLEIVE